MAYYVRSERESGRYIRTNAQDGRYLAHSFKGSMWTKGHKYIDKRLLDGEWKYLYPEMLEKAKRAGEAVKATAEKVTNATKAAYNDVKTTAKEKGIKEAAKKVVEPGNKAIKDFKNYYKETDIKAKGAKQTAEEQEKRKEQSAKTMNQAFKDAQRAQSEKEEAEKQIDDIHDRWHNGKVVNQKEVQDAHNKKDSAEKAIEENHEKNQKAAEDLRDAEKRKQDAEKVYEEAKAEKETAKYKASKALNDLIDGTNGLTAQGARWLKNQYEAGSKFAINTLAAIEEKGISAVAKGNSFLKNLLKGNDKQPATASKSISGRKMNGVGQKAKRREAIGGGPVSNNNYSNRPKKRR